MCCQGQGLLLNKLGSGGLQAINAPKQVQLWMNQLLFVLSSHTKKPPASSNYIASYVCLICQSKKIYFLYIQLQTKETGYRQVQFLKCLVAEHTT